jgi:hypothetical protein
MDGITRKDKNIQAWCKHPHRTSACSLSACARTSE